MKRDDKIIPKKETIGTAILIETKDKDGKGYLAIEGVLAGPIVKNFTKERTSTATWRLYYEYILEFAKHLGYSKLFINTTHKYTQTPHDFVKYVADLNNEACKKEDEIEYNWVREHGVQMFKMLRPENPGRIIFEKDGRWFTHWLKKEPLSEEVINKVSRRDEKGNRLYNGEHYAETWYLHNKYVLGRSEEDKPQWNTCKGYVRGFEVDVEEEYKKLLEERGYEVGLR